MENMVQSLSMLPGISGREKQVREFIISNLPEDVTYQVDRLGNLIVHKEGLSGTGKNKLMLCAHMDEVGLIITYITEEGYLKFDCVGGIDPAVLIGRQVVLECGLTGIIGLKHIHQCSKEEQKQIPKVSDLFIDIGAKDREEAQTFVKQGDFACFASDFLSFGNEDNRWKGKALDDRVGCAILLNLLKSAVVNTVDVVFTVQEEVGARGAGAAAFGLNPDIAVVVETTTAGDICGVSGEKRACLLGKGPVVPFMDRGTVYDEDLYQCAFRVADSAEIPCQTKTVIAGGNDSSSVQSTGTGVRVLAISVPTRYLHSPACVMDKRDVEATEQLVKTLVPVLAEL